MLYTVLVILIVLVAILMIGVVLIQESKGGGLSANFSSSNNILGVRKTNDIVENTTWGLAIAMVILSIVCTWVAPNITEKSVLEKESTTTNTATPGFGTSAPAQGSQAAPAQGDAKQAAPAADAQKTAPAAPAAPAK